MKRDSGFVLVIVLLLVIALAVLSTVILRQAVLARRIVHDQHEQVLLSMALWQGLQQVEQQWNQLDSTVGISSACGELPCSNSELLTLPQVRWTALRAVSVPKGWQVEDTVQPLRRFSLGSSPNAAELECLQITVRAGPIGQHDQGVIQALWLAYRGSASPASVLGAEKLGEQSRWRLR